MDNIATQILVIIIFGLVLLGLAYISIKKEIK